MDSGPLSTRQVDLTSINYVSDTSFGCRVGRSQRGDISFISSQLLEGLFGLLETQPLGSVHLLPLRSAILYQLGVYERLLLFLLAKSRGAPYWLGAGRYEVICHVIFQDEATSQRLMRRLAGAKSYGEEAPSTVMTPASRPVPHGYVGRSEMTSKPAMPARPVEQGWMTPELPCWLCDLVLAQRLSGVATPSQLC